MDGRSCAKFRSLDHNCSWSRAAFSAERFTIPPERAVPAVDRAELFVFARRFAFEEPAATGRRGAAGALKHACDFTGEPLP
jgi:hypothetical protein